MVRSKETLGGRGVSKEVGEGMWIGKRREGGAILRHARAAAMCARRVVRIYVSRVVRELLEGHFSRLVFVRRGLMPRQYDFWHRPPDLDIRL